MILFYLIIILLTGGLLAWIAGRWNTLLPRIISLAVLLANLLLIVSVYMNHDATIEKSWWISYRTNWIPSFGISLHLAIDGLSMLLLMLTYFIGILSVLISWKEINKSAGFFHFNILWILSGITGVFLSLDLFLFYFFWELMLVPMYFLISIWGHENRLYASYKFFLYTQASGLLMFISILALYFIHARNTGIYSFDYNDLIGTTLSLPVAFLLMLGFLVAFLVKLPAVPLHNWLPDAHTEAPTAGSLILAGLLLKTGAYGLLRFVLPLFPEASIHFAPVGMLLGVIGILYGAKLAFAQTNLKRLVAYTSVSHMGFVLLGVYAFNELAYQGVIMQMIAHAISTGALFIIVGQLYERIHTQEMSKMEGFWHQTPVMGAIGLIFSMASLGLPGMGNFIAEFFILAGTYKANITMTCLASLGLIGATIYSLRIMQKVFYGKENPNFKIQDLSLREKLISASLVITILYLGLFPQRIFKTSENVVLNTVKSIEHVQYIQKHQISSKKEINTIQADQTKNNE